MQAFFIILLPVLDVPDIRCPNHNKLKLKMQAHLFFPDFSPKKRFSRLRVTGYGFAGKNLDK
jgi:hypothetical protein